MKRSTSWKALTIALTLGGLVSFHSPAAEPPAENTPISTESERDTFMHTKLEAAHQIVDGLAFEDFALIERGTETLLKVGEEASWKVRRDPAYMHYAADFQVTTERLRNAARRHSIEEATFAYVHLTVSCTACHQHVRNVVQVAPARPDDVGHRFTPAGRVYR